MARELNAKQLAFVNAYLKNGRNATQAAITAGYSKKVAGQTGAALVKHPQIKNLLSKQVKQALNKCQMTAEEVIGEITRVARTKPRGKPRWSEKIKALDTLAKFHKLLTDNIQVSTGGEPVVVLTMPANGREAPPEEPTPSDG